MNSFEILRADHAVADQRVEVDDLAPVVGAVEQHHDLAIQLGGLLQGQDLEHLVQRAEAAREGDQRAGGVREPELAHEEVVELERQARA